MVKKLISFWLAPIFLTACTSVKIADDGGETHQYFGFVSIQVPETDKRIKAYKISSYGLAIENGLLIGARDTEMVLVPLNDGEGAAPDEATCSMVVIVRSGAEAEHAHNILKNLEGDTICLATFQ